MRNVVQDRFDFEIKLPNPLTGEGFIAQGMCKACGIKLVFKSNTQTSHRFHTQIMERTLVHLKRCLAEK